MVTLRRAKTEHRRNMQGLDAWGPSSEDAADDFWGRQWKTKYDDSQRGEMAAACRTEVTTRPSFHCSKNALKKKEVLANKTRVCQWKEILQD